MMGKGARNAALLGGAAALLASKMMGGKGKSTSKNKPSFADIQDAEAGAMLAERGAAGGEDTGGVPTQRLADFRGKSGNADMDIGPIAKSAMKSAKPATAQASQQADRKAIALNQANDAVEAAQKASEFNRERASYLNRGLSANQDADAIGAAKTAADFRSDRDAYLNKFPNRQAAAAAKVNASRREQMGLKPYKKGGAVKSSKAVSSASKRGDGIAMRGKTKGRMV